MKANILDRSAVKLLQVSDDSTGEWWCVYLGGTDPAEVRRSIVREMQHIDEHIAAQQRKRAALEQVLIQGV